MTLPPHIDLAFRTKGRAVRRKCYTATEQRRLAVTSDRYMGRRYPYCVSDNFLVSRETGWRRERSLDRILQDVLDWIAWNADQHGQFYL